MKITTSEDTLSGARTTKMNLRTTDVRLLHFILPVRSLLPPSSLPCLSFQDGRIAQRDYKKGLDYRKSCCFSPLIPLTILSLAIFSSRTICWKVFHTFTSILSILSIPPPKLLPFCLPCKACNMQWKLCHHKAEMLLQSFC